VSSADTWKCEVCGYVHRGGQAPESCPVCGVDSSYFTAFEAVEEEPAADAAASAPPEEAAPESILVLGSGIAALSAVQAAREQAPEARILMVGEEARRPYYRLNLTRFLAGEVAEDELPLQPDSWFEERSIERRQAEVREIDREAKEVILDDGSRKSYERLVLALGAHPFVPPIPGSEEPGVHVLRTLDDARRLRELATAGARCVVIGGGLLGIEAAAALASRGLKVDLAEGFDWLLPRQLPRFMGRALASELERIGVTSHLGVKVGSIVRQDGSLRVQIEEGPALEADFVLVSTGVRPNSHLARRCDLEVKHGVLVDDSLRSSDPAIFAAGDLTEHRGRVYGIWPASDIQGAVAGHNSAGGRRLFKGIPPSNRLKVLGVDVFSVGVVNPEDGSFRVLDRRRGQSLVRLVHRDGRLTGAAVYGDAGPIGRLQEAVETGRSWLEMEDLVEAWPDTLENGS